MCFCPKVMHFSEVVVWIETFISASLSVIKEKAHTFLGCKPNLMYKIRRKRKELLSYP